MKIPTRNFLVCALACAAAALVSCDTPASPPKDDPKPPAGPAKPERAVYVNLDGFAFEYLAWANEGGKSTPNLNALIAEGAFFANVKSGVPTITRPMQTSIVTGAWPAVHGNAYRYFDPDAGKVVQTSTENSAETIAQSAARGGLNVASVQQFALQDDTKLGVPHGTSFDDPAKLYVQPGGIAADRVAAAIKILKKQPVAKSDSDPSTVTVPKVPEFLALYIDDLDAVGHNESAHAGLPPLATDYDGWKANVVETMLAVDAALGDFFQALKDEGLWDTTAIFLTSDHGMAFFSGTSSLPELTAAIAAAGLKCEVLGAGKIPAADTKVVVVTVGLQAQLSFVGTPTAAERTALEGAIDACRTKPWFDRSLDKAGMDAAGAHRYFGDYLVSPKSPYHFKTGTSNYAARGQHDSLACRHVPFVARGPGIRAGVRIDEEAFVIDVIPTLAASLGVPAPAQATGKVLSAAFVPAP